MAGPDTALEASEAIEFGESSARPVAWTKHRNYVLAILFVAYFLNSIDRNIVNILQQAIKAEFRLDDFQLGLMTGFAFALFYASIGLPAARMIDRGVKRTLIVSIGLALWSLMTGLSGLAQNYWQLLLCRAGVGVGEGSFAPSGFTLISDYFGRNERARATGIFLLGLPTASLVGLASGGWIAEHYGWRSALMIVGLPGLIVALIFKLTVKEPPRGLSDGKSVALATAIPLGEVFHKARSKKTFVHLLIAGSLASFCTVGGMVWFPAFLMRGFGLNTQQIGLWWGVLSGVTGMVGAILGGQLSDRLGARDPKYVMLIPAMGMLVCLPFFLLAVTTSDVRLAFAFLLVPATLNNFWLPPAIALTQGIAPLAMRAIVGMLITFALNLCGHGFAPPIIGKLSDVFGGFTGSQVDGLRWALISISIFYPLAAFFFVRASRSVATDLED